jgi:hypothetical protein
MPVLRPFPIAPRHLWALVAVVVVIHGLVLSGQTNAWRVAGDTSRALITRTMDTRLLGTPAAAPSQPAVAPPAAPVLTPPQPFKPPDLPPKFIENKAVAHTRITQAATETIAILQPIEPATLLDSPPPTSPDSTRTLPTPALANATSAPSAQTATASLSAAPREPAPVPGRDLALKFPASGTLSYLATQTSGGQPRSGTGTLEWTTDGHQYQLRLESSLFFLPLLVQTSVGSLGAEGLQPERFSDKRLNRSEKAAHFRRDTGRITFSGNPNSPTLQRGAQDRLSLLMQLAAIAAGSPTQLAQLGSLPVQVVSADDADTWLFVVEGEDSLYLPAGHTTALRLARNPRKEFDAKLQVWLAPELGYVPVRIVQTESNGNSFELQLRSPSLR